MVCFQNGFHRNKYSNFFFNFAVLWMHRTYKG